LCQVIDCFRGFGIANALDPLSSVTLLARKELQALFEIAPDHSPHGTAVGADDLREKVAAHEGLAAMLLLGDDLQQNRARDVLLRLLVHDHEINSIDNQPPNVRKRDVPALN